MNDYTFFLDLLLQLGVIFILVGMGMSIILYLIVKAIDFYMEKKGKNENNNS